MAAARRRNLLRGRRRIADDGEEDEEVAEMGDDSASDASALTDTEDQSDAEESDISDHGNGDTLEPAPDQKPIGLLGTKPAKASENGDNTALVVGMEVPKTAPSSAFPAAADTLIMLNGFQPNAMVEEQDIVNFEDTIKVAAISSKSADNETELRNQEASKHETQFQKRVREREEYKLKRATDPAFVPTRGGFFMHDQRNDAFDQLRPGPFARGRGRGTEPTANPRLPLRFGPLSAEASKARWHHDLHETVINQTSATNSKPGTMQQAGALAVEVQQPHTVHTSLLSKSISLGTVMVRCLLPATDHQPKLFRMTVRQHTRLPDLRPPLRRDKPVRVSLPEHGPRYLFPSMERSFIFIPRAQRPNHQIMRTRVRSVFSQSESRRSSAQGGSADDPSISMSRNSSLAPDVFVKQDGSIPPRLPVGTFATIAKPVVRLPLNAQPQDVLYPANFAPPVVIDPPAEVYVPGMAPSYNLQDTNTAQLPMHQPQPQKAVSLATIETPEQIQLHAPQPQEQQPFYHQVPAHMGGQGHTDRTEPFSGTQFPLPSQAIAMASSNIPEAAINAEPFQPSGVPQQAHYTTPYISTQPMYYYSVPPDSQQTPYPSDNLASSVYAQQGPYLLPIYVPSALPPDEAATNSQSATFAQERNGMVYYYDSSQLMGTTEGTANTGYTVPGAGGMLTPGPEGYYYTQAPMYYQT